MDRDMDKGKTGVPAKEAPTDKSAKKHQSSSDDGKRKRGWRDVFDSLTYSSGPGDNIYVFG